VHPYGYPNRLRAVPALRGEDYACAWCCDRILRFVRAPSSITRFARRKFPDRRKRVFGLKVLGFALFCEVLCGTLARQGRNARTRGRLVAGPQKALNGLLFLVPSLAEVLA